MFGRGATHLPPPQVRGVAPGGDEATFGKQEIASSGYTLLAMTVK
jgi:hypothetical protein